MIQSGRACAAAWSIVLAILFLPAPAARAQFGIGPVELSGSISLDEADSAVRAHLERVRAYVADHQWDEAVETLRQVMENHGAKMIPLTGTRYVNLADYCHVQIASLAARGTRAVSPARRSACADLVRARAWPAATRRGWPKSSTRCFAAPGATTRCGRWARSNWSKGTTARRARCWERLIEIPPARVTAERFEAARGRSRFAARDGGAIGPMVRGRRVALEAVVSSCAATKC